MNRKNNHEGRKRRRLAAELLISNDGVYEDETDDENNQEDAETWPSNLGRPKGRKDKDVHFKIKSGRLVIMIPQQRYIIF